MPPVVVVAVDVVYRAPTNKANEAWVDLLKLTQETPAPARGPGSFDVHDFSMWRPNRMFSDFPCDPFVWHMS